jgi:hypothetical protein
MTGTAALKSVTKMQREKTLIVSGGHPNNKRRSWNTLMGSTVDWTDGHPLEDHRSTTSWASGTELGS